MVKGGEGWWCVWVWVWGGRGGGGAGGQGREGGVWGRFGGGVVVDPPPPSHQAPHEKELSYKGGY